MIALQFFCIPQLYWHKDLGKLQDYIYLRTNLSFRLHYYQKVMIRLWAGLHFILDNFYSVRIRKTNVSIVIHKSPKDLLTTVYLK